MSKATQGTLSHGLTVLLLTCLLLFSYSLATANPQPTSVCIGVPSFWNKEETQQQWQPLADYLSQSLPATAFCIKAMNLEAMETALAQGDIDFIFINPSLYVLYTYRYGLSSPLATVVNRFDDKSSSQFAGAIFTRQDHPTIHELTDLRGKTLAAVSPSSLAAYQMQRFELLEIGLDTQQDASMLFTGLPLPQVVAAVMSGEADAGFIRAGVLEEMVAKGQLEANSYRLLGKMHFPDFPLATSTRLYPEWPFAALPGTDQELARQVTSALQSLPHEGEVAQQLGIAGFTIPGDYRTIDQLLRELRLPPFDEPQELTLREAWEAAQYYLFALLLVLGLLTTLAAINLKRANTALQASQERIHRLAYYDPLTGLPNRAALLEQLRSQLDLLKPSQPLHLLLFNLDRFKTINNARGSQFADQLLQQVAKLLLTHVTPETRVYRLSGDEFALLGESTAPSQKLLKRFAQPLMFEGEPFHLSVSLGGTQASQKSTPEALLSQASTALDLAKQRGGSQAVHFEATMGEEVHRRFEIEKQLPLAINQNQLQLFLQPQVDAEGQVAAAEVLVRWQHPEQGLMAPGQFIPVAEASNLIVDLGVWVLEASCRLLADARNRGLNLKLAVNISPRHFRQVDFVERLKIYLDTFDLPPSCLTLEVTENLVINDLDDIAKKMQALRHLGVRLSIDDFGTGYSSLAYLKRLPLNELKIDRCFVQDAVNDPEDAALVDVIFAVAENLGLQVVAEGVETQEQSDFLNQHGKLLHQGYFFGRPGPADFWINTWLKQNGFQK